MRSVCPDHSGPPPQAPRFSTNRARIHRRTIGYLSILGVLFATVYVAAGFTLLVDPLGLYPWGVRSLRIESQYGSSGNEHLLRAIAAAGFDTLVLGGSTARGFTPALVAEAFPESARAFTFTYSSPRPTDQRVVFAEIARMTSLERLILAFDWIYMLPREVRKDAFPYHLFNDSWHDDHRAVRADALNAAGDALLGRVIDVPGWGYDSWQQRADWLYARHNDPASLAVYRDIVTRGRPQVLKESGGGCADLTALPDYVAFARDMAGKGVRVDILVPPYSLYSYFEWNVVEHRRPFGRSFLERQLRSRRCLVEALSRAPNIRIHAFDNEDWLTGDLANYYDSAHLYHDANYRYVLKAIREGSHLLDAAGFDEYAARLRQRVGAYQVRNSALVE
jgi:hypothetical protein